MSWRMMGVALLAIAGSGVAAIPARAEVTIGTGHLSGTSLAGVSCQSLTACEVVGPGYVQAIVDGAPATSANDSFPNPGAIGCAAGTATCLVAGNDGSNHAATMAVVNGAPGGVQAYPDTVSSLAGVACAPGGGSCVAVGEVTLQTAGNPHHALVVPVSDGAPAAGQYVPGGDAIALNAVTCPTASCIAVGRGGSVVSLSTAGGPSAPVYPTGPATLANLNGVACRSVGDCVAVGTGGIIVPITAGTPGAKVSIPGVSIFTGVACSNATTCVAVGNTNAGHPVVVPIDDGAAGSPIDVLGDGGLVSLGGVACSGVSCVAIGSNGGRAVVLPISTGPPPPTSSAPPQIAGAAVEGQALTTSDGSWTGSPTAYAHQWQSCDTSGTSCTPIPGATGQSYTVVSSDVGHTVRVLESATNDAGTGGPVASAPTGTVTAAPGGGVGGGGSGALPPSTPGRPPLVPAAVSSTFAAGRPKLSCKGACAQIAIDVPGPGTVTAADATTTSRAPTARSRTKHPRKALIRPAKVTASRAGRVTLELRLSSVAKKTLKARHEVAVRVKLVFAPVGGAPASKTITVTFTKARSGG